MTKSIQEAPVSATNRKPMRDLALRAQKAAKIFAKSYLNPVSRPESHLPDYKNSSTFSNSGGLNRFLYTESAQLNQILFELQHCGKSEKVELDSDRFISLPRKTSCKQLLILDLDETLVHCVRPGESTENALKMAFDYNGNLKSIYVRVRPYAQQLLRWASANFELVVFTASHQAYADAVLDYLDPGRVLVHHRLYRDSCTVADNRSIKDLRVFDEWDLSDIIIVDNSITSFNYQLNNGIPVSTWLNDPTDNELLL